MRFPVLLRGHVADFLKCLGKITAGRKTGVAGDFFDAVIGGREEILGGRDPDLRQVCDRGFPVKRRKLMAQIVFCNVAVVRKRAERDFVVVIFFDIALGLVALAAAVLRVHKLVGHMVPAAYQQDEDGQIMLADFLIAVLSAVHFPENALKAEADGGSVCRGVDNAVFDGAVRADFQPFHTQNIVIQRIGGIRKLRVQNLRADQDKAVCLDRDGLVFDLHISGAALDEKDFGKLVAVRKAGPVILVFGGRDGQKPERQFRESFVFQI